MVSPTSASSRIDHAYITHPCSFLRIPNSIFIYLQHQQNIVMSQHSAQLCLLSKEIVKARFAVDSPPVLHLKVQQLKANLACDSGTVDETDASPLSSRPQGFRFKNVQCSCFTSLGSYCDWGGASLVEFQNTAARTILGHSCCKHPLLVEGSRCRRILEVYKIDHTRIIVGSLRVSSDCARLFAQVLVVSVFSPTSMLFRL